MTEQELETASQKRALDLIAFSSMVDALRASGPLTQEKKALLQQTATAMKISPDRYKAEIRRALARPNLNGDVDETSWAMEGRRDTFLLPRKPTPSTMSVPYAAYTTDMVPALAKLPKAPYKSVQTQTIATKAAPAVVNINNNNPKQLVVVSSPRSQPSHTMVYAKPTNQRQVRISNPSNTISQGVPVVLNSKGQSKVVQMSTVVKPSTTTTLTPVNAQKSSQHLVVSSNSASHNKQIFITTPSNIVHKISTRGVTHTLQVKPTAGPPVVTKLLNPNRTSDIKVLQKPRIAQVRALGTPVAQLTPVGVRLTTTTNSAQTNGKNQHSFNIVQDCTPPPAKVCKSVSQWNYDDHSVMAKPPTIAPNIIKEELSLTTLDTSKTTTTAGAKAITPTTNPQTKTVQIVQMSTTNAQCIPSTKQASNKPIRMVTPTQVMQKVTKESGTNKSASGVATTNVVVQSLPYQGFEGSIYKMVTDDVIIEEEVA